MKTASEILAEWQIKTANFSNGHQKTTCPECSHLRRNKRDRCLSVKIDEKGVVIHCHHCGLSRGNYYDGAVRTAHNMAGKAWAQSGSRVEARRSFRYSGRREGHV